MTICVAAICDNATVIGASDRMLTAGDIQFEPAQTKIMILTNSIVMMLAGDSSFQAEIFQKVSADVQRRVIAAPNDWWNVSDVAELYRRYYNQVRFKNAESAILAPLGLDGNTYIARQKELDTELAQQIATELLNYRLAPIAAICCGFNVTGPHIYVIENGEVSCRDTVGFAAIGAGMWHASSQLMFVGHTRYKPFAETLQLIYSAKRRAEVAPGVGTATDMFLVGSQLGFSAPIPDHVLTKLAEIYHKEQERVRVSALTSKESVTQYVEEIAKAATAAKQATIPADGGGSTPAN